MAETVYKRTKLFGGALECDLPEQFADVRYARGRLSRRLTLIQKGDVSASKCNESKNLLTIKNSTLRQVPDAQEVFIDKDGFTSIIFDITERVGGPGSSPEIDGKALTTHLEELVGTDVDTVKVWNSTETSFSKLEYACLRARLPPKP